MTPSLILIGWAISGIIGALVENWILRDRGHDITVADLIVIPLGALLGLIALGVSIESLLRIYGDKVIIKGRNRK